MNGFGFAVTIELGCRDGVNTFYYVRYYWNTNLRDESETQDIPIMRIAKWLGN